VQVLLSPNNIIFIEWSCDVSEGEGEGKGKGEGEGKGVSMKHEARTAYRRSGADGGTFFSLSSSRRTAGGALPARLPLAVAAAPPVPGLGWGLDRPPPPAPPAQAPRPYAYAYANSEYALHSNTEHAKRMPMPSLLLGRWALTWVSLGPWCHQWWSVGPAQPARLAAGRPPVPPASSEQTWAILSPW
jgi:hypothetical protein